MPERFAAPRLEVQATGVDGGTVRLEAIRDFQFSDHTSLSLFDVEKTFPRDPQIAPQAPIEGPTVHVCDNGGTWKSKEMEGSDDMMLIVAPGDLEPAGFDAFELQFNQNLVDIADLPAEQVAVLTDLGPAEGCQSTAGEGYPRPIPVSVELAENLSRLLVTPVGETQAGHRFRLEVKPKALKVEDGLAYWATAPRVFDFAIRPIPAEVVGGFEEDNFPGGVTKASDMLKLGNLLIVSSQNGHLLAVDVTDPSEEGKFKIHSVSEFGFVRSMATDGHNRIFYNVQFGSVWGVKALRLEDARKAEAECAFQPDWAEGIPCFKSADGSVRTSFFLGFGGMSASEFMGAGSMPMGNPKDLEILTQDEEGKTLELTKFYESYVGDGFEALEADAAGFYTFDLELKSTYQRAASGEPEPSLDPETEPVPAVAEWRSDSCDGEEPYDRFQRVTVDNLSTGQSWSFDIENPWPEESGQGTGVLEGLRARRGDELRVRYNVRAVGYLAILGSGITVVDLNRFYGLPDPLLGTLEQCGRRLGKFEGQTIQFPECAEFQGALPQGIAMTPAVALVGDTGCDPGPCRGDGTIHIYSPLYRVGAVHTLTTATEPGGIIGGGAAGAEGLQVGDLAACIDFVGKDFAVLRDVAVAADVKWFENGVRGKFDGTFTSPSGFKPTTKEGDLLFVSMGMAGVFVFDITDRRMNEGTLIGHLKVGDHAALLLHVDRERGLLFAGGVDFGADPWQPIIDVWDISFVNSAPKTKNEPRPRVTIEADWSAGHIAVDGTGTGLLYTWDAERGAVALPFENPEIAFSGHYLPEELADGPIPEGVRSPSVQRPTSRFVPLGVPMEATLEAEEDNQALNESRGTAALKLRVSLPGSFGQELTAKVQSLRALPDERFLGREDVGAAVAVPGGPGWPETEVTVTLRRLTSESDEGENGRFATVYNLYESVETVLLVADPRARRGYHLQDVPDGDTPGGKIADEKAQCRRCDWPSYLPDPKSEAGANDPALANVKELLAGGRYVRAFLSPSPSSSPETRQNTEKAIAFFEGQGENYRRPAGWARVAAPADAVASPIQASLAEPAQNPSFWVGEAGVGVSLAAGEALLTATDHSVAGRSIPFSFDRTYRSGMLGYGELGSAGWGGGVFAHLREIETTGEVEYHDGRGHVWRFFPQFDKKGPPSEYFDEDPVGENRPESSYYPPKGVYLRLQKLSGGTGWRMYGRHHDVAIFNSQGRLVELSDRHRQNKPIEEQGHTHVYTYDSFGQLILIKDDLGRKYRFDYYDDPEADGHLYGLLEKITDFVHREVEYVYDDDRRLTEVRLAEVGNPTQAYASFAYQGARRPTLRYEYDPTKGVTTSEKDTKAILHGDYAPLRLESCFLPQFVDVDVPRVRLEYDAKTGRVATVSYPTPQNNNDEASGVRWAFNYPSDNPSAAPATQLTVVAPWSHELSYKLSDGRTVEFREELMITPPEGASFLDSVGPDFTYSDDGHVVSVLQADGGRLVNCYADGAGADETTADCTPGSDDVDRLQWSNVVDMVSEATSESGRGTASYQQILVHTDYQADNYPQQILDGLTRAQEVVSPLVNETVQLSFKDNKDVDPVTGNVDFNDGGLFSKLEIGTGKKIMVQATYDKDADGRPDKGLLKLLEYGGEAGPQISQELEYDDAFNVKERKTSYGTSDQMTYDEWDRVVKGIYGLSTFGHFASLGTSACGAGSGARVERAFDAAGHLVRERRLQDYIGTTGTAQCRWVESRYEYNAREQLIAVEQTHLASPHSLGSVIEQAQPMVELKYDEFGRVERQKQLNLLNPDLETVVRYDDAGRIEGVQVGESGETLRGYDEKSRVVRTTDGDEGEARVRYDAWDRVYHEEHPTGAVVEREYDKAHNPTRESVYDGDPSVEETQLLAETRYRFTNFGEPDLVAAALSISEAGIEYRVTQRVFDSEGRVTQVLSGPGTPDGLDKAASRREVEIEYEPLVGRVLQQIYGGEYGTSALYGHAYVYDPDNLSPWADAMVYLESVPGEAGLINTVTTTYKRDTLGRPTLETHTDGRQLRTEYDRSSDSVIRTKTGAETTTAFGFDGRGLQIRVIRPQGRGETTYAYDLDGRLLHQSASTASGDPWDTIYSYDSTGRVTRIDREDGSTENRTYNLDNTTATFTTRDNVLVEYGYDAANRLRSAVPSMAGTRPDSLVPLDAGDFWDHDELSRLVEARRGSESVSGIDPRLTVSYPSYDLASRPASEIVGGRAPLEWKYDTWNRPVEVRLPAGVGRSEGGSFQGFRRQYDTLDRLVDISGIGQLTTTPLGATFAWGGAGRLYGCTTKGPLGTAARYGYIAGRGAEPPEGGDASNWRLGTLTWGSAAGADPIVSATSPPSTVWGQFGFGWRGGDGAHQDGVKTGRLAVSGDSGGMDLFAGMGWSWDYDDGVRLLSAGSGRGSLRSDHLEGADQTFRYNYGQGDELLGMSRQSGDTTQVTNLTHGPDGRITHRDGFSFKYDAVGRRTEDDRYVHGWNWRGQLVSVTVKGSWPQQSQSENLFPGRQVRYEYDALGRLSYRSHLGELPAGTTSDALRPLIGHRTFIWEGQGLLSEIEFGNLAETPIRWRKTYVPGASGIDDSPQIVVDVLNVPGSPYPGRRLYTYVRDELGTVVGLVAEDEAIGSELPLIARYLYTPFGEAHAEIGLELRQAIFENNTTSAGSEEQAQVDPETHAAGALRVRFSAPVEEDSIVAGFQVEHLDKELGWVVIGPSELVVSPDLEESTEVVALLRHGWARETSYRARLSPPLSDTSGRIFVGQESLEWSVPGASDDEPRVIFERTVTPTFELFLAARNRVGDRFPGGQTYLFQGLWTDPQIGLAYARNRFYDARTANWLSEDPLGSVDSKNRYAFVGLTPHAKTDALGLAAEPPPTKEEIAYLRKKGKISLLRGRLEQKRDEIAFAEFSVAVRRYLFKFPEENRRDALSMLLLRGGASFRETMTLMSHFFAPAGTCGDALGQLHCGIAESARSLDTMLNAARVAEIAVATVGVLEGLSRVGLRIAASARSMASSGRNVTGRILKHLDDYPTSRIQPPQTDYSLGPLDDLGYTTPSGQIYLNPHILHDAALTTGTVRHEAIHSLLTPMKGPLLGARRWLNIRAYHNSALLQGTEEILAESFSTRSLRAGIRHAFGGQYETSLYTVNRFTFTAEGVALGGISYKVMDVFGDKD